MKRNTRTADRIVRAFLIAPALIVAVVLIGPAGAASIVLYALAGLALLTSAAALPLLRVRRPTCHRDMAPCPPRPPCV